MKTVIYYFSGRGNSLKTARDIANDIEESEIHSFRAGLNGHKDATSACVGFIFPVINFGAPSHIPGFIQQIVEMKPDRYYFAVVLNGGDPCGTLIQAKEAVIRGGSHLTAGFLLDVRELQGMQGNWSDTLQQIVTTVTTQANSPIHNATFVNRVIKTNLLNRNMLSYFNGQDKQFWVDENCNDCRYCEEICPVNNIELVDSKPRWLHHCDQCYGCYAWCPRQAIHMGKKDNERLRDTNPQINLSDILQQISE